jgi:hypothetical protein
MYSYRPKISFSIKPLGILQTTTDLATVVKWKKDKHLILFDGHGSFNMVKDDKSITLSAVPESVDKAIALWKKGFNFAQFGVETKKQKYEKIEKKLNDTLERVANCIMDTNAQMANYFRNAVPYKHNSYMVVDFPTKGNKIKRVTERFKKEGKPYATRSFYHGTNLRNISSIIRCGLKPRGRYGMLGTGIYVGKRGKALNYSDFIVLEVKVALGNCKEIEVVESLQRQENEKFDSMHAKRGKLPGVRRGFLYGEEWIVRRAEQVEISKLIVAGW